MNRNGKYKAVVFDCDGVMFDTERANKAYYNQILRQFGRPDLTDEQFAIAHMVTADEALAHLFEAPRDLELARAYRRRMDYRQFIGIMEIEAHLISLLRKIRPAFHTAVATNRSDSIGDVLRKFDLDAHFDLVVCAMDVARPKPYPDILLRVVDHFRIEPSDALYVGDSLVDEKAARSAGMHLAAYKNRTLSADFHLESLLDLEKLLLGS